MKDSTMDVDRSSPLDREWVSWAVSVVEAEARRTADTHLLKLPLPAHWQVEVYLKDESTHTSGSLKHRLARSLFLFSLCNGWLHEGSTVVEASSGSTAISEAYFARLLGLPFIAVMPRGASASTMAFITAAAEPIVPASPMPLTPMGFTGLGVTVWPRVKLGASAAVGTR